jgi:hypothetical protein
MSKYQDQTTSMIHNDVGVVDLLPNLSGNGSSTEGLAQQLDSRDVEIAALRAALDVFSRDSSWRVNGVCDPNSGNFRGQQIARKALMRS